MAIPDYQSLMLPLLDLAGDGREHTVRDATAILAKQFNLSTDERAELLPSGRKTKFYDRIGWALTYLRQARLLTSSRRGVFLITPRGRDVLNRRPSAITNAFLEQFAEFQEFRGRPRQDKQVKDEDDTTPAIEQTPLEHLEDFYQSIRTALASELLDKIKNAPAAFFEKLVVELLVAMGYGGSLRDAGQAIGQSGDEGIDGIIKEDKLGLDAVYIQAKRWGDTVVGSKTIREFVGSLVGQRARKGVLITTSRFTKDALEFVNKIEQKVVLIDGTQLAQYMIDYNIGVVEQERYIVKKVDLDYFEAG